jgi:hypothetical protein
MQRPNTYCTIPIFSHSLLTALDTPSRKLETKACHATLIFVDCRGTILLGVFGIAEEHAFVSSSFLIFAHAAGLAIMSEIS